MHHTCHHNFVTDFTSRVLKMPKRRQLDGQLTFLEQSLNLALLYSKILKSKVNRSNANNHIRKQSSALLNNTELVWCVKHCYTNTQNGLSQPGLMHTTATQTQTNTQQHWRHVTTTTPTRSRHTETHGRASGVRGVPVKGELPLCSDQPWQAHEWAFTPACNISEEKGWDYKNYISHDAPQRPTSALTSTRVGGVYLSRRGVDVCIFDLDFQLNSYIMLIMSPERRAVLPGASGQDVSGCIRY